MTITNEERNALYEYFKHEWIPLENVILRELIKKIQVEITKNDMAATTGGTTLGIGES